jgi:hypothetical protein
MKDVMLFACDVTNGGRCYKDDHVVRFEMFKGSGIPRECRFTDIDAVCELAGYGCYIEYKHPSAKAKDVVSQIIAMRNFSGDRYSIGILIEGNLKKKRVDKFAFFWRGEESRLEKGSLEDVNKLIGDWARYMLTLRKKHPRKLVAREYLCRKFRGDLTNEFFERQRRSAA